VPVVREGRERVVADIVGPVCESGDFFARDRELPELRTGELAVLLDAGAYGMSLASNYNSRGRAAEVLIEGGEARLIRRRETVEEMLEGESL
jgi:diaminopimelate decarboxylase